MDTNGKTKRHKNLAKPQFASTSCVASPNSAHIHSKANGISARAFDFGRSKTERGNQFCQFAFFEPLIRFNCSPLFCLIRLANPELTTTITTTTKLTTTKTTTTTTTTTKRRLT